MNDEICRNIFMPTEIEEYQNFFSDDWGEQIHALSENKIKLSEIILDLLMEWRAAAYTASLPATIPEQMKGYHDGFVNTGEINTKLLMLVQSMKNRLLVDEPELAIDPVMNQRLLERLVDYCAKIVEAKDDSEFEFPLEETWSAFMKESAFQLSLWGAQRICYVSIYNSYENFLVRTVCTANEIESCQTGNGELKTYCLVENCPTTPRRQLTP